MRQRLIFSGGIQTLTLLILPPLPTLKVPSQIKEIKLNKTRQGHTICYHFIHSECIHYKSFLYTSYLMLLHV